LNITASPLVSPSARCARSYQVDPAFDLLRFSILRRKRAETAGRQMYLRHAFSICCKIGVSRLTPSPSTASARLLCLPCSIAVCTAAFRLLSIIFLFALAQMFYCNTVHTQLAPLFCIVHIHYLVVQLLYCSHHGWRIC
jgi:hypothetical protein